MQSQSREALKITESFLEAFLHKLDFGYGQRTFIFFRDF